MASPAYDPAPTADPAAATTRGLQTPVRPHFFSGQILSEEDLSALVDWSTTRLSLVRQRRGAGVVCGLTLQIAGTGDKPLRVTPGYAIDASGRDIVVPEAVDVGGYDSLWPASADPAPEPGTSDAQYADIILRADERPHRAKPTLGREHCMTASACDFTRVTEGYTIEAVPAGEKDRGEAAYRVWLSRRRACLDILNGFPTGAEARNSEAIERYIRDDLKRQPPRVLPGLEKGSATDSEGALDLAALATWLFGIVLDRIMVLADCPCDGDDEDTGIRLGRVRVLRTATTPAVAGSTEQPPVWRYRVDFIDDRPPAREDAAQQCLPAPAGKINLATVLWYPPAVAESWLAERGVKPAFREPFDPIRLVVDGDLAATLTNLKDALDSDGPVLSPYDAPSLHTMDFGLDYGGERVVLITPPAAPGLDVGLGIETSYSPSPAHAGGSVTGRFRLQNVGRATLIVESVDDTLCGADILARPVTLPPGGVFAFERAGQVAEDPEAAYGDAVATPDGGNYILTSLTMARGRTGDGQPSEPATRDTMVEILRPIRLDVSIEREVPLPSKRYAYKVANTGEVDLHVHLVDRAHDIDVQDRVEAGQTRVLHTATYPQTRLAIQAEAVGVADDGRQVVATTHSIRIVGGRRCCGWLRARGKDGAARDET